MELQAAHDALSREETGSDATVIVRWAEEKVLRAQRVFVDDRELPAGKYTVVPSELVARSFRARGNVVLRTSSGSTARVAEAPDSSARHLDTRGCDVILGFPDNQGVRTRQLEVERAEEVVAAQSRRGMTSEHPARIEAEAVLSRARARLAAVVVEPEFIRFESFDGKGDRVFRFAEGPLVASPGSTGAGADEVGGTRPADPQVPEPRLEAAIAALRGEIRTLREEIRALRAALEGTPSPK